MNIRTVTTTLLALASCSLAQPPRNNAPLTTPEGQINFDRLRQLIDESRGEKKLTPEQQKLAVISELKIDRSPSGILAVRMLEAKPEAPAPPAPAVPPPVAPAPAVPAPAVPATPPVADGAIPAQEMAAFKKEAETFRRDVILGRWENAALFLKALPESIQVEAFQALVTKISAPSAINPPAEIKAQGAKPYTDAAFLPPMDWLGLVSSAPKAPDADMLKLLAKLLPANPHPQAEFFEKLKTGVRHLGGNDPVERLRAAEILLEVGFIKEAEVFLPDLAEAKSKPDYKALNLIARHRATLAQSDATAAGKEALPLAWEISISFLNDTKAPAPARSEALFRALSLIPSLGDGRGKEWLEKTFATPEGGGLELLGTLGTLTTLSRENPNESIRLEQLKTQSAAVKSILSIDGVDPEAWSGIFTLFARQWNHEANITREKDQKNSRRNVPQFDPFGNMFYTSQQPEFQGQGNRPISTGDILDCRPDETWLAHIEPTTRNLCLTSAARLFLKVKEENAALPLIEKIAAVRRDEAVSLVKETIRVWSDNHNPNEDQKYRQQYMYFYGYNNQAGSIPLTRSKQERNLVELAALVKGIRGLDLNESFHKELTDAFIACHSQAEVWRVESIERVFGSSDALDAETLGSMTARMRLNLAGLWPNPKLQEAYKTKRKDTELQEQILKGYAAAKGMIERALEKKPAEAWRLSVQLAALHFEESNYRSTIAPDSNHSGIKRASLDALATATDQYIASLPLEDSAKETTDAFEVWIFAALGSPSLEALKGHHLPTETELPKIKAALAKVPADCAERHLKKLANTLNTRLANVSPDLKLRYLDYVSKIVGDRKEMTDAMAVLAFYRDLVSEIQLSATLDGPDRIDATKPFGLRVNLRHTKEIEREAGGFQRYLQNQTGAQFSWNFGRPPEDYRDKFEKAARAALEEHFEIVSLTFHSEKVESRTDAELGWRMTPYAYFLLKAKGPQIDRIPPLKIDLDFTDTSGYVILPITSAEIPVSASGNPEPRPFRDLRLSQTLDERSQEEKGSLFLEIKATAHGVVPALEHLLSPAVDGFETVRTEDQGVRIAELDAASDDLAPVSEREWRIELKPISGRMPASFRFPPLKVETVPQDGLVLQRYVDVDLVPVSGEFGFEGKSTSRSHWLLGLLILPIGWLGWKFTRRKTPPVVANLLPLPSQFTPVTVLSFLRKLREEPSMRAEQRLAIDREIDLIETRYFGRSDVEADSRDLREVAMRWQQEAA